MKVPCAIARQAVCGDIMSCSHADEYIVPEKTHREPTRTSKQPYKAPVATRCSLDIPTSHETHK